MGNQRIGRTYVRILLGVSVALFVLTTITASFDIISDIFGFSPKYGPLSSYLRSNGIYTDKTIYLTMASKDYIEPIINFKTQLDKFALGESYVVLCVDTECLEATKSHHILGFGGYLATETEAMEDWHNPIARMKVRDHF